VLAIVILSVRPSVRLSRPGTDSSPGEIETPGASVKSLVSCEKISCRWVRRSPRTRASKMGTPLRNRYFTTISLSSVRMLQIFIHLYIFIYSVYPSLGKFS